jgi:hypothetical protein
LKSYTRWCFSTTIPEFESKKFLQKAKEVDPCAVLMDVSLYDHENPIMDWFAKPGGESMHSSDEYDDEDDDRGHDSPCPSIIEVRKRRVRNTRRGNYVVDEETDGDEEEEEDEEADIDNNDQMLRDDNQPLIRKSTRKKKKSVKLLSALKATEGIFLLLCH